MDVKKMNYESLLEHACFSNYKDFFKQLLLIRYVQDSYKGIEPKDMKSYIVVVCGVSENVLDQYVCAYTLFQQYHAGANIALVANEK